MTIRVGVANLDNRDEALIRVRAVTKEGVFIPGGFQTLLKGGQKTEVHVHSGQQLEVCEVPPEVPAEPVAEVPTGTADE